MSKLIGFREAKDNETNNAVSFIRRSKWTNGSKFQITGFRFMVPVYKDDDPKKESKLNSEARPCPVLDTTLDIIYINSRFKSKIDKDDNILKHDGTFDQYLDALLDRQALCQMSDTQTINWLVEHMRGVDLVVQATPYVTKEGYPANWIDFYFESINQAPQLPTPQQQTAPQQPQGSPQQPQPAPQQPPYQAAAVF